MQVVHIKSKTMNKQLAIQFALVEISTEEFATFEENFQLDKEVSNNFDFGLSVNSEERLLFWNFKLENSSDEKLFLKGVFLFAFMISPESWEKIKKKNRITFPKDFLTHCAALSIGTMRGILYEKVSKMEKEFNYNQKFTYKQLTPKSRINSLLLIDELKNYPDSYSILYSDVLVRFNDKDFEKKMDKLFNLSKNYSVEISKLRLEIDDFKRQFLNKPMYYPIWEKQEVVSYCSYIDIVLWCYSNSSLNKSLSK